MTQQKTLVAQLEEERGAGVQVQKSEPQHVTFLERCTSEATLYLWHSYAVYLTQEEKVFLTHSLITLTRFTRFSVSR